MAKKRIRKWGPWRHSLLGAFLFSLLAIAPVLFNFSTYKFGPNLSGVGSDSYGVLYSFWIQGQPADGVVRTEHRDLLSGFPNARPIIEHIQAGSALAEVLAKLGLPAVACYNLMIWAWFLGAYLVAYWIFTALNCGVGLSHLGAFLIALNPYQTLQSVDHADLAMTWPILLDIYLLIQLLVVGSTWALPLLILLTGLSVFSHPYYLISLALMNALPLLFFGISLARGRCKLTTAQWLGSSAAALGSALSVWWWKALFTSDGGGIQDLKRDLQDLYVYSTKFWDFVLPPHYSWLFERWTTEFKTEQTVSTGSNFVENTLYPGALILITLCVSGIWVLMHRKQSWTWLQRNRSVAALCAMLLVVPIALSISPTFDLLGFKILSPTYFLHQILPQFRTMSRFGYVASIAMVMICMLILQANLARLKPIKVRLIVSAIFLFTVLDVGYFHKNFYSDSSQVPKAYQYLRDAAPANTVVFEVPFLWGAITQYWQSYHRRPNFGHFSPGDPNFADMLSTRQMDLATLIKFAHRMGITHLVLHSDQDLQIPGLKFENQPDETWIFFLFAKFSYVLNVQDFPK